MTEEHPFAQYIRTLGKGQNGSRALTETEAYDAMRMILLNEIEPLQLGAYLMLMRVKEESPEEVAASVRAIRDFSLKTGDDIKADLDWSSYAGKKRQLPWYLLATLAMADQGIKVFMHGAAGHTAGRIYSKDVLPQLGIQPAASLQDAEQQLKESHFCYIDLEQLCPKLHEIIEMRPLLGLRSPVHTIARMLNPFNAPHVMQGIFHPGYQATHQNAAVLLGQPHLAVVKGEGGEIERNPDTECLIQSVHQGKLSETTWPAMFSQRHMKPEELDISELARVWHGTSQNEYGQAAIVGSIAFTLFMMGRAADHQQAEEAAQTIWSERNKSRIA